MRLFFFRITARALSYFAQASAHLFLRSRVRLLHAQLGAIRVRLTESKTDENLAIALIAGEDHRFYFHYGIDPMAICRAAALTLLKHRQGGSTIEQQLVRTITQDYRRNVARKLKELLLASTVAQVLSKDQVLATYLSIAYFGTAVSGIEQLRAVHGFPTMLELKHSCAIVACLKYPMPLSKVDHRQLIRERRTRHILSTLEDKRKWLRSGRPVAPPAQ
jgi:membrane peptidoglycan carboxypeptidase